MGGLLCQWAYRLAQYRWGGAPLGRWLRLGLLGVTGLAALGLLPGRWLIAGAAFIAFALSLAGDWWAKRRQYVIFIRQQTEPPTPAPLRPQDKVLLRATGFFEVQDKGRTFTELPAYFRTFATREHAVMAWLKPPRWLLVGSWPAEELGMWYIFFRPEAIQSVEAGLLRFGRHARPALRVTVQDEKRARAVYLSFDGEEERRLVWADLVHDDMAG